MARARLKLLAKAREDMIHLRRYSRREFGAAAADRLVEDIERVFRLLREHPLAGSDFSEAAPGLRLFPARRHRIFYRATEGTVEIVRVLHHSREVGKALEE
jgi:toxin ParE1/3/4